jgi:hypothetical protein
MIHQKRHPVVCEEAGSKKVGLELPRAGKAVPCVDMTDDFVRTAVGQHQLAGDRSKCSCPRLTTHTRQMRA